MERSALLVRSAGDAGLLFCRFGIIRLTTARAGANLHARRVLQVPDARRWFGGRATPVSAEHTPIASVRLTTEPGRTSGDRSRQDSW